MNAEAKLRRINWHQAIAEVVLIILGILVALAVDSWWDVKAERAAETEYLESLRADFVATRDSLNREIEWEEQLIRIGQEIHSDISSGLVETHPDQFLKKVSNFYKFSSWEPITTTYNELVGSGHLEYIRSQRLRTMMSEFVVRVDRLIDYRGRQISNWQLSHRPFLYQHVIVSDLNWMTDYRPDSPFENDLGGLESKTFWNLVSDWMTWHDSMLSEYEQLLAAGQEITDVIDSELAK